MNQTIESISSPRKARVEIIPLIDVVFFLLATFVLFTLSLHKLAQIDVVLPRGGTEKDEGQTACIQATEAGAVYWKVGADTPAELIAAAELRPRLASYKRSVPVPRVFIRSDGRATFGSAVWVFDEVRLAGIKHLSVETRATKPGS